MSKTLILHVNGTKHEVGDPDPDLTLSTYLRDHLHLTGTKIGCGASGCGSCTVQVARQDHGGKFLNGGIYACNTKLWTLHGCHVTTVEGLGTPNKIHPIQESLYKNHGVQCGFCSPGMVMSMVGSASGDIEDVSKCLQGNLCRCTGYRPILEAFKDLDESAFQIENPQNLGAFASFANGSCFAPKTLDEVKKLMFEHRDNYEFVQGGTGQYQLVKGQEKPTKIFLGNVNDLKGVEFMDDKVVLGAGLRLSEFASVVEKIDFTKPFHDALATLASPQIRNQASVGGAIMWNHPASDLWPLFRAFQCKLVLLTDPDQPSKEVGIEAVDEYKGSLIVKLIIPKPKPGYNVVFKKKAKRKEFDLAILNMSSMSKVENDIISDISIYFGGLKSLESFQGQRQHLVAISTMKYLQGKKIKELQDKDLRKCIQKDLENETFLPQFKESLALAFVKSIFVPATVEKLENPKSCQVYRGVDEKQSGNDLAHRSVPHMWGADLACGTAVFIDDMKRLSNECDVVLIRSEKAHAKIKSLDFSEALKQPGIVGHVSAQDLTPARNLWGLFVPDEEIFASTVQYHGQIIGALICHQKGQGYEALEKVKIEYEEDLPFVLNLKHAREVLGMNLEELPPLVFPAMVSRIQDPEAEANAETIELSGSLRLGAAEHFYMEPHSVRVVPLVEKDELIVYHSTQEVTPSQKKIANALGLPMHKVIVKNKRCGGGFGGKERMHIALIAAVAAHKYKKPMRLIFDRKTDFGVSGQRHESMIDYKVKADKNTGKIVHADFKAYANAGCSSDLSPIWVSILLWRIDGGYTLQNFNGFGKAIKTNSPSNTSYRGFGGPEGLFYIETILDRIAFELKLPLLQVKEINLTKDGDLLHHSESRMQNCTLGQCWKLCLEQSKYNEKMKAIEDFNGQNADVKRGISIVPIKFPPGMGVKTAMRGSALVRVYEDGSVLLTHGGIEMGQGLHTKMIQVASRTLDIDPNLIHINEVSTETLANTSPTGGSCGSDINGPAVMDACQKVMEKIKPYKEAQPDKAWVDWVNAALDDRVCLTVVGHYDKSPFNYDWFAQTGNAFAYFTYGVAAVQVQVHCLTGQVEIVSADLVMDLGKSMNPGIDIGQIEGAFVQGMGNVTTEQLLRDVKTGKLLTDGPSHYKIPTIADIPKALNVTLLDNEMAESEHKTQHSPIYSSKGIGEPPICASAAVIMAIKEAIKAYRKEHGNDHWFSLEPPCTPDKICSLATNNEAIDPQSLDSIEM